jgi:hypothetical protein
VKFIEEAVAQSFGLKVLPSFGIGNFRFGQSPYKDGIH